MKIGISATMLEPSIKLGQIDGIGVYTKDLLAQYEFLGYDVVPISFPPFNKRDFVSTFSKGLVFPYSYPITTLTSLITSGRYILNTSIEKQLNLFHATDYRIPRFKKIPVVATLHDALVLSRPDWYQFGIRSLKNWVLRKSIQWADRIITVSKTMIPELVECWCVKEEMIDVVHNGISDWWLQKVSKADKEQTLKKFNLQPDFLFFVGTLQPKKNLTRLIQAYKNLPIEIRAKHHLVLVGKNGWQSEELLRQISFDSNIKWLAYVSTDQLRVLYQSAKLLVFPSLHEGFGFPILEAFASEIPVVTSNIAALPEIAGDAAYFVDPYDIDEIRYGIQSLLNNEDMCLSYIRKGIVRVKEFNWVNCAKKTMEVYKKLI